MNFQPIEPIRPLWAEQTGSGAVQGSQRQQPTLFSDVLQSVVDTVKETENARNVQTDPRSSVEWFSPS